MNNPKAIYKSINEELDKVYSINEMAARPEEMRNISEAVQNTLSRFVNEFRGVKNLNRVTYEKTFNISERKYAGKYIVYDLLDGEGQRTKLPGGNQICFVGTCQRISYFFREFTLEPYINENFFLVAKNSLLGGASFTPQNVISDDSYIHFFVTKREMALRPGEKPARRKAGSIQLKNVSGETQVILDFRKFPTEMEVVSQADR